MPVAAAAIASSDAVPGPRSSSGSRAIAAAVVLSVAATTLIVGSRIDDRLAAQDQAIEDLAAVTTATIQVTSEPDAERVALDSPTGAATTGTLLYSPSTTDTVVVATGLSEPTDGSEYHCWVEVDGARQSVGKMFFGGGIAYWVGPAPAVSGLSGTETFGVSLVGTDGEPVTPDPVLVGDLLGVAPGARVGGLGLRRVHRRRGSSGGGASR